MADQARANKLAKRIAQIVASAIEHEVKDPRLAMVTVTEARVTGDLHDATVFYTVLGPTVDAEPDAEGAAAALASATGVLRSDGRSAHRGAVHPDAELRRGTPSRRACASSTSCWRRPGTPTPRWPGSAAGAKPAGDPDPYRVPREDTEE